MALYGTYDMLLNQHLEKLKAENVDSDVWRKAVGCTYDDLAILFDVSPTTARHVVYRMQALKPKRQDTKQAAMAMIKLRQEVMLRLQTGF